MLVVFTIIIKFILGETEIFMRFSKIFKERLLDSSYLSVRPPALLSIRMEQMGSH
jgi:hypothetical protein